MRFQPRLLPALLLSAVALAAVPNRLGQLKPGEGAVLIKWAGIWPSITTRFLPWQVLKFVNKANGQVITVDDSASPLASYSCFVTPLPAGTYTLGDDADIEPKNQSAKLGTFTVKPGACTNLGLVAWTQTGDKYQTLDLVRVSDAMGQASALEELSTEERTTAAAPDAGAWEKGPDPETKAFELARNYGRETSLLDVGVDGKIRMGGPLGLVQVREADGGWTSLPTGTLDAITCVRALEGGRIFAGTERGDYLLWSPEEKRWTAGSTGIPGLKILRMEPVGTKGFVFMGELSNDSQAASFKLFFKSRLEGDAPAKELLSVMAKPYVVTTLPFYLDGEALVVFANRSGFFRSADRYRIDPVSGEIKQDKVDHWVWDIYRMPGGELVKERLNGITYYADLSADGGKTWTMAGGGLYAYGYRFVDVKTAYALKTLSHGSSSNSVGLMKSSDGGRTWAQVGEPIRGEDIMELQIVGGRVFVGTPIKLVSTADEGKTWRTEWPLSPRSDKD